MSESQLQSMAHIAQQFCNLVEEVEQAPREQWVQRMAVVLPRLHAAVAALDGTETETQLLPSTDLETRFELFSRLRALLGEYDGYWLEFDKVGDERCKSGSLADDFTDIYFDLKSGLAVLEQHPADAARALALWKASYKRHWGQHVVDASRQLYSLTSRQ
jgi:hypothetical protein